MKTATAFRGRPLRRMGGLSLIELMISIVIGLVLMIAVVSAYLGSASASRVSEAQSRMNEDAQAALNILAQQIRMAGNNPKQANYAPDTPSNPAFPTQTYAIRGCSSTFTDPTVATIADLACSGTGSHAIAIAYEADQYNTVKAGTRPTDCLGSTLTAVVTGTANVVLTATPFSFATQTVSYALADNRFYVGTATNVLTPSLYCRGNGGGSAQPLVENVESMYFSYGTAAATATSTLTVKGYLDADGIDANTDLAALTDSERWKKVVTVRICVLVRSEQPIATNTASARYIKCDGVEETSPPDLRLRRAYSTTVVLRNRVTTE